MREIDETTREPRLKRHRVAIFLGLAFLALAALKVSLESDRESEPTAVPQPAAQPIASPQTPAPRQTSQPRLSAQAQQTLNSIMSCGLSEYHQQLVSTAIKHLGVRADDVLLHGTVAIVAAVQPDYLCGQFRIQSRMLTDLPPCR